jgi:methyl-accepting chemotaxis protein
VTAIHDIAATIETVGNIGVVIAAAVDRQGTATAEIARNVQQAAAGTLDVTNTINGLTVAAEDTRRASGIVLGAAEQLAARANHLSSDIRDFVAGVQAA